MAEKQTPMMQQYRRIKADVPDGAILFFRLGDFYEMFFEDAKRAAPVLEVALTKRNKVPMCGVPYHAAESYLAKLIRAGFKVAICDQVEDPSAARGIVRRAVTRVVTPGTVTEDQILDAKRHNFLAGVCAAGGGRGLAALDLSTGHFYVERIASPQALFDGLKRLDPNECILPAEWAADPALGRPLAEVLSGRATFAEDWTFSFDAAHDLLTRHFAVHSLAGFGCEDEPALIGAAGAVLHYVREELHHDVRHIRSLRVRDDGDYLMLDEATCRHLDLVPGPGRPRALTLLGVLDATATAMGGRLLRDWVLRPLDDLAGVQARHAAVAALCDSRAALREVRGQLAAIRDLERVIARVAAGGGNPRDLVSLAVSLRAVPEVRRAVQPVAAPRVEALAARLHELPDLLALIEGAIVDEPPVSTRDGGVIRPAYNAELDELREAATEGRRWLARYQAEEQERTGIKNLKVRHNKVFGYYIEVTRGQLDAVPEDYIRKQTLVNAERFITPPLKEYENRIIGAHERAVTLEQSLFEDVRRRVADGTGDIQDLAAAVAELDCLAALADRAAALNYVRPVMTGGDRMCVKAGRHPVIEQMPDAERFVPNDVLLDGGANQLLIITGPNMAGKSTYIRQVALCAIMAQAGSFVPAEEAELGLVDRVFTRVGASDDLARGRSTFMVEMQETANILNNATPRSLVVLDEIGRGTSTFDGISIAWAVAEYLHNTASVKAKTLFATHYHELTDLARTMTGVRNYNVLVREHEDRVVFLRRIVAGGADKSYGIQVARLAGLPEEVVARSKEILANLEEGEFGDTGQPKIARRRTRKNAAPENQLDLF